MNEHIVRELLRLDDRVEALETQECAAAGVVTGSAVALQIAYWNTPNSIAGDAGLTYDPANDIVTITPAALGGITFAGASTRNRIRVPDNVANALFIDDAGGLEYLRINSQNANPYFLIDPTAGGINIGVGTATPTFVNMGVTYTSRVFLELGDLANHIGIVLSQQTDTAGRAPSLDLIKSRAGAAAVVNGDTVGAFTWRAHDGTDYNPVARIAAVVNGAVAANTIPTDLILYTTTTNVLTAQVWVLSTGDFGIGAPPSYFVDLVRDQNAATQARIRNATNDTAARVEWLFNPAGGTGTVAAFAAAYTTAGSAIADSMRIRSGSDQSGGLNVVTGAAVGMGFWTNDTRAMFIDANQNVVIGDTVADRRFHANVPDAATNTITYVERLSHLTSGVAAALYGLGAEHELEDAGGNPQVASEVVTLWATATAGVESPLRRWTTYPQGSAGPGYCAFWTWDGVDGTARTVIPGGAGDVTAILRCMYAVAETVGGGTSSGEVGLTPGGGGSNIYADGVDTLTLTVNAGGDVVIQRTAGADTFQVALWLTWV